MHNVTLKKNKNSDPARSDVATPTELCQFITDIVLSVMKPKIILDPSSGLNSNLTQHFDDDVEVIEFDILFEKNFLDVDYKIACDLVLCNPPFNNFPRKNNKLYPEVFLKKIFSIAGKDCPVFFFTPIGLRLNTRLASSRLEWLSALNLTSVISLPLDSYGPGVAIHSEILVFNCPRLKPHYTYHPKTIIHNFETNFTDLHSKLQKFISLENKVLSNACRTAVNSLGLQDSTAKLLAALIPHVTASGNFNMNDPTRQQLADAIGSSKQVVTNCITALCSVNLVVKIKRGHYFYNFIDAADCRKLIDGHYDEIAVDVRFFNSDPIPKILFSLR